MDSQDDEMRITCVLQGRIFHARQSEHVEMPRIDVPENAFARALRGVFEHGFGTDGDVKVIVEYNSFHHSFLVRTHLNVG